MALIASISITMKREAVDLHDTVHPFGYICLRAILSMVGENMEQ